MEGKLYLYFYYASINIWFQVYCFIFLSVTFMRTQSSLWENPLSSSYQSCTHCKYAVNKNHSTELALTLFKSSSGLCNQSSADMCNGLLNDVVLL